MIKNLIFTPTPIITTNNSSIIKISPNYVKKIHYNISYYHNELKLLSKLNHNNIINIHRNYLDKYKKGIIEFKYYKDGDLLSYINKNIRTDKQTFTTENKIKLFKNILEPLLYCHYENIVHGDIKPDNFLLENNKPIVIDFGLSIYNPKFTNDLIKNPVIFSLKRGTNGYMAPEIKDNYIGPCSDVFSLGIVLYNLFTNEMPEFNNDNIEIDSSKIYKYNIPYKIDNLINDMTHIDYNQRPTLEEIYYDYNF